VVDIQRATMGCSRICFSEREFCVSLGALLAGQIVLELIVGQGVGEIFSGYLE
jgi:hypothetical protein